MPTRGLTAHRRPRQHGLSVRTRSKSSVDQCLELLDGQPWGAAVDHAVVVGAEQR